MRVMKFGGASVKDADAIRRVSDIIRNYTGTQLLVVVSAIDKTTNQLEILAHLARDGEEESAWAQYEKITQFHTELLSKLFDSQQQTFILEKLQLYFEEIRKIVKGILLLEEFPPQTYDRIVAYGELLSTTIVSAFLNAQSMDCRWLDARQLVKTDASYKRAELIWSLTEERIRQEVKPLLQAGRVLLTQGFIGSTTQGKTTTLGREGSDYSASIFAACLDAECLIVWKDVPGILNADPRLFDQAEKIDKLSYSDAVEMTFYGAQVIHPKTIKPIFNKSIPMYVRSFKDLDESGTLISHDKGNPLATSVIQKSSQTFVRITPRDFSFMDEKRVNEIFGVLYKSGVKVNLVQNSAISLMLCIDQKMREIEEFRALLLDRFEVEIQPDLTLFSYLNASKPDLSSFDEALLIQWHAGDLFVVKKS